MGRAKAEVGTSGNGKSDDVVMPYYPIHYTSLREAYEANPRPQEASVSRESAGDAAQTLGSASLEGSSQEAGLLLKVDFGDKGTTMSALVKAIANIKGLHAFCGDIDVEENSFGKFQVGEKSIGKFFGDFIFIRNADGTYHISYENGDEGNFITGVDRVEVRELDQKKILIFYSNWSNQERSSWLAVAPENGRMLKRSY